MSNPLERVTDGAVTTKSESFSWREFFVELRTFWPTYLLAAVLVGVFVWQLATGWNDGEPGLRFDGVLSAEALREGRWQVLFSAMLLHASVLHLLMNVTFLLALGPVINARLGGSLAGALWFSGLFLVCGLAGDALYLALQPADGGGPMLGASGALCGFWGAAARLADERKRLFTKVMGSNLWSFAKMHLLLVGLPLLLGLLVGKVWVFIAWQAHVGGFVLGALLVPLLPWRPAEPAPAA